MNSALPNEYTDYSLFRLGGVSPTIAIKRILI